MPNLRKLPGSQSLYEDRQTSARIYIRYSKVHGNDRTFFGLRTVDLRELEGRPAVICFLWDGQPAPLLVPYASFEEVFAGVKPANDGQYKVQVYLDPTATELYIPSAGRFNVEGYFGWNELNTFVPAPSTTAAANMTHSHVQGLLGAIGAAKGHDIWIPPANRADVNATVGHDLPQQEHLPPMYAAVHPILSEVDVLWLRRGGGEITAMFEVEHTTSVYSGLLRFNDVHLIAQGMRPRFSIVANDTRRSLFVRQLNRPTFVRSGLSELCTFLEYANVIDWHRRIVAA